VTPIFIESGGEKLNFLDINQFIRNVQTPGEVQK